MLNKKDLYSGILTIFIGVGVGIKSLSYQIGNLYHMGPGYFPLMIAIGLTVLGLIMLFQSVLSSKQQYEMKWKGNIRAVLSIVFGLLAFGLLGKYGGFVPATVALIAISSLGVINNSFKTIVFLSLGVLAAAVIIFYYIAHIPFPLFQWG